MNPAAIALLDDHHAGLLLARGYTRERLSVQQLADRAGRSTKWVRARLAEQNVTMRPARRRPKHELAPQAALAAYAQHGTVNAAAAALGVPALVLTRALRAQGVPLASRGRQRDEWPARRILAELRDHVAQAPTGQFPTRAELRGAGRYALLRAIDRTGGAAHWSKLTALEVRGAGRRPRA